MMGPVLLVEKGVLVSPDGQYPNEKVGWVAIEGGRIAAVGTSDAPEAWRDRTDRVVNARGMAVLPGLVNGHTHLSQTFLRGLADGRPLLRWLREVIWPAQAAMTAEDMYLAALLGLVENLCCGVTTVVQHQKLSGRQYVEAVARAANTVGLRVVLARGWADLGDSGESLDEILTEMRWLHETWGRQPPRLPFSQQEKAGDEEGRFHIASGPMAPWRCSDDAMRQITALARQWGMPTHIHVAEAKAEIDLMLARCGKRHLEWLADLGCLGPDTQLVHCVHVTDAEVDLIARAGATVITCPTSNMYLASGAAPLRKMCQRGIPVALGTDGSGSNNSQDLLECAKIGILLAKHQAADAQALLPEDMVRMMTANGTRLNPSPSSEKRVFAGRLVPGAPADLTIVNLNTPRCQPVHSAGSAVVYNASGPDVHTVIVAGDILLDAGQITMLDEDELLETCRSAAAQLLERAAIV